MQVAKKINPGFSTADAEYPEIRQEDGDLTLSFKDWQERSIEVFFGDAIAFKWQMAESFPEKECNDSSYKIENSDWLKLHVQQGIISSNEGYSHYKFNFNDIGQFEVIALCYTVKIQQFSQCFEGVYDKGRVLIIGNPGKIPEGSSVRVTFVQSKKIIDYTKA